MTNDNFVLWMEHFIHHVKPTTEEKVLLICDNHKSHLDPRVLSLAKNNGVVMLTFPPHTTHRLQPLDVAVYGPFQRHYNVLGNEWQISHPGQTISLYDIGELSGKAFLRSLTPEIIVSGFKKTGIFPTDENIFTDVDFLPSSVTDRQAGSDTQGDNLENLEGETSPLPSQINQPTTCDEDPQPSTSCVIRTEKTITPAHIKPFPKALPRKNNTQRRKMSSMVLTDTPVKQQIEDAAAKRASSTKKQAVGKKKPVVRKRPLPTPETSDSEDEGVAPVEPDTDDEYREEEPEADIDSLR